MTMLRPLAALSGALVLSMAANARADQCDFALEADLRIEPDRVLIEDAALGPVAIGADRSLSVDGRRVELDAREQAAVGAYAEQLRAVVPQVVDTALEGAEIGISAATEVLGAFLGDEIPETIRTSMAKAREEVQSRVGRDDEVWFVYRGGIRTGGPGATAGDPVDAIGPAIEQAVSESVGAMLVAVGTSLQDGEGSFTERMEAFGERMERLGEEIEQRVEPQVEHLEAQADVLCAELQVLALREAAMKRRVPELAGLRILERG